MPFTGHADAGAMARDIAQRLHGACTTAIAARGRAWLALAGGSTPLPAYRAFAATALPWHCIEAIPTDERCVPAGHPACNLRALGEAFAGAHGFEMHALTTTDGDCDRSLEAARALLARHRVPFDAVVLGMGADAHFASLFPGAAGLAGALDAAGDADVVRIDPDPLPSEAPFARISLTLARLLRARELHLVVTGDAKRRVLGQAAAGDDPLRCPVAALLHAKPASLHVHWAA
ncbi:MAG TPA: 6-phosphogluconolactonase [Xanthomonadaceae bacterium]|nr:6-phosphogluconolactonase [Xanthomonadaceae bacterium]